MQNLKLKVIFKYLRPYKKEFFFGAIALLLVNILSVVITLEVKNIIAQLQEGFSTKFVVKKSILLAKAKLVDRITGEMNNTTVINKEESGTNEDLTVAGTSKDTINNVIADTVAKDYVVVKTEILSTKHKSYRAYVLIEMKKKNIDDI